MSALDDLDDLDLMLETAVEAAKKRKAEREAARKAHNSPDGDAPAWATPERPIWAETAAIARYITTSCSCGASHRRFDSWYILSELISAPETVHRLERCEGHNDLPASTYTTQEETAYCTECLGPEGLLPTELAELEVFEPLGQPETADERQLSLF